MPDTTEQDVQSAWDRLRAAEADMSAWLQYATPIQLEKADAQRKAFAEWQRLYALSMPLRDWLLGEEFDPVIIHTRPPTVAKIAKRAHRPQAEVQQVLDELVAEGIIARIGKGYDRGMS